MLDACSSVCLKYILRSSKLAPEPAPPMTSPTLRGLQGHVSDGEALACAGLAKVLPLPPLGEVGISEEERLRRLEEVRQIGVKITSPEKLEEVIADTWTQEELELPRHCVQGGSVRALLHRPLQPAPRDLPLVVWAHGGGLCCMTCYATDLAMALKAAGQLDPSGGAGLCCWASVDYRLAPEAQYESAVDDVVSAYLELIKPSNAEKYGYSPSAVGLAGISAGAFLVAHAALRLAAPGGPVGKVGAPPPAFMALDYPMLDPRMNTRSWELYGEFVAPRAAMRQCWQWTLAGKVEGAPVDEKRIVEASPSSGRWERLGSMRAMIMVGKCDPMFDEGMALVERLRASGLQVQTVEAAGTHAFAHKFDPAAAKQLSEAWLSLLGEQLQ